MGRVIGALATGLLLVGCVTPYAERVGASGPMVPAVTAPPEPAPVATTEAPATDAEPEAEAPVEPPKPEGIDVSWTFYTGAATDKALAPLGGPEEEAKLGAWKCTISKQETVTEGSHPVARTRTVVCKNWGDAKVGTSVTCDLERPKNEATLNLDADVVVVACAAK